MVDGDSPSPSQSRPLHSVGKPKRPRTLPTALDLGMWCGKMAACWNQENLVNPQLVYNNSRDIYCIIYIYTYTDCILYIYDMCVCFWLVALTHPNHMRVIATNHPKLPPNRFLFEAWRNIHWRFRSSNPHPGTVRCFCSYSYGEYLNVPAEILDLLAIWWKQWPMKRF
jgi:hypothetical protein